MDGVMVDWVHWQTQRADLASKQAAETASGVIRIPFVFRHGCFCELLLRSLTCANTMLQDCCAAPSRIINTI